MKDYFLVDLNTQNSSQYLDLFLEEVEKIRSGNDTLYENYVDLDKTYCNYPVFHCLFESQKLIAFAAIQTRHFPQQTCRLWTRFYTTPDFRFKGAEAMKEKSSILGQLILKSQIKWAIDSGMTWGFISMQSLDRRPFMKRWAKNRNREGGYGNWKLENDLFLTYPCPSEKSCWQSILSTRFFKEEPFPIIPNMKIEEYKEKFERGQYGE